MDDYDITFRFGEYPDYEYVPINGRGDDDGMAAAEQHTERGLLVVEIEEGVWRSVGDVNHYDWETWEEFWTWLDEWLEDHGYA